MEPIYRYSESTVRPLTVEVGKRTVFLRKDVTEVTRTDEFENAYTIFTYLEAKMSHEEFNEYSKLIAAQNAMSIDQIMTGQINGDNNQLIIMEAIADLYDVIAMMM